MNFGADTTSAVVKEKIAEKYNKEKGLSGEEAIKSTHIRIRDLEIGGRYRVSKDSQSTYYSLDFERWCFS